MLRDGKGTSEEAVYHCYRTLNCHNIARRLHANLINFVTMYILRIFILQIIPVGSNKE